MVRPLLFVLIVTSFVAGTYALNGDFEFVKHYLIQAAEEYKNRKNVKENIPINSIKERSRLGRGAGGEVFKVTLQDGETAALKKMEVKKKSNASSCAGQKEVGILAGLNSPFIVKEIGISEEEKDYCDLFLELMNRTLGVGVLNEESAKIVAAQVALGLLYLHHVNISHGDLETENILLDDKNNAKIADFGVAIRLSKIPEKQLRLSRKKTREEFFVSAMAMDWAAYADKVLLRIYPKVNENEKFTKLFWKVKNGENLDIHGSWQFVKDLVEDPWFKDINWTKILKQEVHSPMKPSAEAAAA